MITSPKYRILCVGENWLGSDARASFFAFRRMGHSIHIIDEREFVPVKWQSLHLKIIRKLVRESAVRELAKQACELVNTFKPHLLFVFKGNSVYPSLVDYCKIHGVATANYYPDISFMVHGPYIPRTIPLYDYVFTTKSFGIEDMKSQLGVKNISFLEPGFDPEIHRPIHLTDEDYSVYGCDVTFIGTWSPKKEMLLTHLIKSIPQLRLKIWGCQWEKADTPELCGAIMGHEVIGDEYTKAILGSSICLGLLSEQRLGATSGDLITARTFQIPACGAFMLHERTSEIVDYFEEGSEITLFSSAEELSSRVRYYLSHQKEREIMAENGRKRSLQDGYSIDNRMGKIIEWLNGRIAH